MARRADCFASFEAGTDAQLLADWRWLIGAADFKVIRVTAFGSLFLRDSDGGVRLLDTTRGWIREVAASEQEWTRCLDDIGHRRMWLLPFVVELLRRDGVLLKPGQCYSWKHPPHLGGEMAADQRRALRRPGSRLGAQPDPPADRRTLRRIRVRRSSRA